MLERALETEAAMGGGMSAAREVLGQAGAGENRVDMLEIPGKGRCYVYLARWVLSCLRIIIPSGLSHAYLRRSSQHFIKIMAEAPQPWGDTVSKMIK